MSLLEPQSRRGNSGSVTPTSQDPSGPLAADSFPRTSVVPDLLQETPLNWIRRNVISSSLAIAFTTGGSPGLLENLPTHQKQRPRGWETSAFATDLYLDSLVAWLCKLKVCGEERMADPAPLLEVLTLPASDEDVAFRHKVFEEIRSSEQTREQVEESFLAVARVRELLTLNAPERGLQVQERRIEILRALRTALETLLERFGDCSSGLSRLRGFAKQSLESKGVRRVIDLLEYESKRATLDVRLGLASNGSIRHFDLVRIEEARSNPFWTSPLIRFLRKIWMLLLGYSFSEQEVLSRAMDSVFAEVELIVVRLLEIERSLAFYLAGLRLAEAAESYGLSVCLPTLKTSGSRRFEGLFNPLLLAGATCPVPSQVVLESSQRIVLVTGPNSGGKTRFLEALGIAQLFGQAGFLVPASSATLLRASGMLASMQVEFGLSHAEGHLGTELLRVRDAFERLPSGGFVVLDELCSGTNPAEAHELIELVLEMLEQVNAQAFVSTHFLDLAERLQAKGDRPLAFLQVEVDQEHRPTFHVIPGVAVTSLARETAARLGVTRQELQALVTRCRN